MNLKESPSVVVGPLLPTMVSGAGELVLSEAKEERGILGNPGQSLDGFCVTLPPRALLTTVTRAYEIIPVEFIGSPEIADDLRKSAGSAGK